jgi:hypothetical protein
MRNTNTRPTPGQPTRPTQGTQPQSSGAGRNQAPQVPARNHVPRDFKYSILNLDNNF